MGLRIRRVWLGRNVQILYGFFEILNLKQLNLYGMPLRTAYGSSADLEFSATVAHDLEQSLPDNPSAVRINFRDRSTASNASKLRSLDSVGILRE